MDAHRNETPGHASEHEPRPGLRDIFANPGGYFAGLRRDLGRCMNEPGGRVGSYIVLALATLVLVGFAVFIYLMVAVPAGDDLAQSRTQQATLVLSEDGVQLARYYHQNRTWVPVDSIAPVVVQALIDTEDRRFYQHWGVDVRRTFGAVMRTVAGERQGGSTITMQLVRNVYPEIADDWAFERKAKEWLTALRLEQQYSKEEILEIYLNTVPFNYNAFGIEAAARTYFNKPAYRLDAAEAATLVGMLKGTTMYNPVQNPDASLERRNVVLNQMREAGSISSAEYERLSARPLGVEFQPLTSDRNRAPYFAEHLRGWLSDWAEQEGYDIYDDGLRVYTTIDSELQAKAEQAVHGVLEELQAVVDVAWSRRSMPFVSSNPEAYIDYRDQVEPFAYYWEANPNVLSEFIRQTSRYRTLVDEGVGQEQALDRLRGDAGFVDSLKTAMTRLQGSFVAVDPETGYVKAWVGGRDFEYSKYDHVAQSKRQPGSTFKPFVYAAALKAGYSPYDRLIDQTIHYVDPTTRKEWSPGNFGEETGQALQIRQGLMHSKNTITAQLIIDVGAERVAEIAHQLGIQSELDAVPSLGLGTSVVTLLEMAGAYASIANNGRYKEPVYVKRIESVDGEVLAEFEPETRQAVEPDLAYSVLDMMRGVVQEGTAVRIRHQYGAAGDLAGKTGTTQRAADGWFMLMHPDLVMGAWVGFPSPAVTFRSQFWGQGAHNALHVVGRFYQEAGLSTSARFSPPQGYTPPDQGGRLLLVSQEGNGLKLRSSGEIGTRRFSVDDLSAAERRSLEAARSPDEDDLERRPDRGGDEDDGEVARQFYEAFGAPPEDDEGDERGRGQQRAEQAENRSRGQGGGQGGNQSGGQDGNQGGGQSGNQGGGQGGGQGGSDDEASSTADLNRQERENSQVGEYLDRLREEKDDN